MAPLSPGRLKPYLMFFTTAFLAAATLLFTFCRPEKNRYERFLLEAYRSMAPGPGLAADRTYAPEHPEMAAFRDFTMTLDPSLGRVPSERLRPAFEATGHAQMR